MWRFVSSRYEVVIGLEVHAQLLTESKLFCGCSTRFGQGPNVNVCPLCLGLPGTLPVLNQKAVRYAIRAGLALDCTVQPRSVFARKNYFYPDLPKGYQISQYEEPIVVDGHLDVPLEDGTLRVGIIRIHIEEDAGKNVHGMGGDSLVDLNRAGVPLIEIVSAPDLRSASQAAAYMRQLREILMQIGVNDGNLEEGSLRCDANVSLRPYGQVEYGTRTELKNLNSFRFVQRAIEVEVIRQTAVLDGGGTVIQETRSFDPDTGRTHSLRSKEEAHDYRYFPEPDLPLVVVTEAMIEHERRSLPMLPEHRRRHFVAELGLPAAVAATLTQHPRLVEYFETVNAAVGDAQRAANYILTEVLRGARFHGLSASFPLEPFQVAEILLLVKDGEISGKQAKELHAAVEGSSLSPREVARERGMRVVSDLSALRQICSEVVTRNPSQVAQYRGGKQGLMGYFVGQVMRATQGSADPKSVNEILGELLRGNGE